MKLVHLQIISVAFLVSNLCNAQPKNTVDRGHALFRANCGACHSITCNRQGPKLEGLFGRRAGSIPDFQQYTPAMKASGIVWTDATMESFLSDTGKLVPGTTMAAFGVKNASDRKDLIAYMRREDRSFELCPK